MNKAELNQTSVEIVCSASGSANNAELKLVEEEIKQAVRPKNHQMVPIHIRKEIGVYAAIYSTKSAQSHFERKYGSKYKLHRTSIILGKIFTKKNQMLDIKTLVSQILLMTISWPK